LGFAKPGDKFGAKIRRIHATMICEDELGSDIFHEKSGSTLDPFRCAVADSSPI